MPHILKHQLAAKVGLYVDITHANNVYRTLVAHLDNTKIFKPVGSKKTPSIV